MRWRAEAFHGRVMTACVEVKVDDVGLNQAYIALPYGYYTPPDRSLRQPDMLDHTCGPFETIDAAFEAAFCDCRRCILQDVTRERGTQPD